MSADTVIKIIKLIIFFLVFIFLGLILFPVYFFFWVWKSIVKLIVLIFKKDYTDMVPPSDIYQIFHSEDPYRKPTTGCINALLTVEGSFNIEILRSKLMNCIMFKDSNGNYPYMKLRQVPEYFCGYAFYRCLNSFKIENYVKVIDGLNEMNIDDFLRARMDSPFSIGCSYWEVIVGTNYNNESKSILYIRLHHCLGDGFSLLKFMETDLFQSNNLIVVSQKPPEQSIVLTQQKPFIEEVYRRTVGVFSEFWEQHKSIKLLPKQEEMNTEFINTCYLCISKSFSMKDLKECCRVKNVRLTALLNSAIFAAVGDFIGREYPKESKELDYLTTVMGIPIPGRPDKFCNHFGVYLVNFPLSNSKKSWLEYASFYFKPMKEVPGYSIGIKVLLELGYILPVKLFVKIFLRHSYGLSLSNIPGPKSIVHLMNSPILNMNFWISAYTDPWITFSTLSYNGQLQIANTGWSRILKSQYNLDKFTKKIESELDDLISKILIK